MNKRIVMIPFITLLCLILAGTGCSPSNTVIAGSMPEKVAEEPMAKETFSFDDYDELLSWLYNENDASERKMTMGADYIDYIHEIKSTSDNIPPIYIPYYDGKIAELRNREGYSNISLMTSELYYLPWIWYHIKIGDADVIIKFACLSQKDFARVRVQNASIAVKNFSLSGPNIDNYTNYSHYKSVTERTIHFSGNEVSALYLETYDDPRIHVQFAYNKTMVIIIGHPAVINNDALNAMSLKDVNEK